MNPTKDSFFKAMQIIAESIPMPFDQTKDGIVQSVSNGIYKVKIQGDEYNIKSNFTFSIGEKVSVLFKCGNANNLYLYPNK